MYNFCARCGKPLGTSDGIPLCQVCRDEPEINYVQAAKTPEMGWICPRCLKVWAPDVKNCDCPAFQIYTNHPPLAYPPPDSTGTPMPQPPYHTGDPLHPSTITVCKGGKHE